MSECTLITSEDVRRAMAAAALLPTADERAQSIYLDCVSPLYQRIAELEAEHERQLESKARLQVNVHNLLLERADTRREAFEEAADLVGQESVAAEYIEVEHALDEVAGKLEAKAKETGDGE